MSPRRAAASLAVVLLAGALGGCSMVDGSDTDQLVPTDGPVAFYPTPSEGGEDTLEGTLTTTGGCVVVTLEDGARVLPVFPVSQVAWDGSAITFGDEHYGDGDPITLTGSYVDNGLTGPVTYIPADCDHGRTFFMAPLAG
ncbi:hypothetical protein [Microbacterium gorillae]|uniref:hypothetical protein n=1 Tax=Microbacterium gorillae TaxID=1231063 RepID=UPI00058ADBCD|nr:hypothetical protein [Microbacterium gorillae]